MESINNFHYLVNWSIVYKSKKQEGPSVKNLVDINRAMLAKWSWKYLLGSWWFQVNRAYYFIRHLGMRTRRETKGISFL